MNNYSWIEKIFHKFALSSNLIREVSFDIENIFISKKDIKENHVFIFGLARSGSTILLNSLYKSDIFVFEVTIILIF